MSKLSKVSSPRPPLMFFGDPHGDFRFVIRSVERYLPQAVVLLGDLQAVRPLQVELAPILDLTEVSAGRPWTIWRAQWACTCSSTATCTGRSTTPRKGDCPPVPGTRHLAWGGRIS